MNEFFRCPRWSSGTAVLLILAGIILFLSSIGDSILGTVIITPIFGTIVAVVCVGWVFWNIWNIKQDKSCYSGFDGTGSLSYLNPFKKLKQPEKQP